MMTSEKLVLDLRDLENDRNEIRDKMFNFAVEVWKNKNGIKEFEFNDHNREEIEKIYDGEEVSNHPEMIEMDEKLEMIEREIEEIENQLEE